MTEELADILEWMDVFVRDGQIKTNGLAAAQILQAKIAAVRAQAAEAVVKLPNVRLALDRMRLMFNENTFGLQVCDAALAELDAAEGKGEGRG